MTSIKERKETRNETERTYLDCTLGDGTAIVEASFFANVPVKAGQVYAFKNMIAKVINSLCTTKTDQNEFYKVVRKRFKQFCYLPKCLPNSVVKMTLGGLEELAGEMAVRALKHLEEDGLGIEVVDVQHKVKYFKDLPRALYPVFDAMYRSACSEHNRILSRAELKVHSIEFNILQVLEDYQIKRRKNEINRQLRTLAATLQGIGRRFTSRATLTKPLPEENKEDETE